MAGTGTTPVSSFPAGLGVIISELGVIINRLGEGFGFGTHTGPGTIGFSTLNLASLASLASFSALSRILALCSFASVSSLYPADTTLAGYILDPGI